MPLLPPAFYLRTDVVQVAKDLLGKFLVTRIDGNLTAGKIVETEAYRAPDDKACHAYKNRCTNRTKVMFREGGVAYVYLCYGIHHLFNVVTGPEQVAHAVLIRGLEPVDNIPLMLERRNFGHIKPELTAGPGVLTKALGITTSLTGVSLLDAEGPIWIEDRGLEVDPAAILASPRVGVSYAEECALWEWRFRIEGSDWTSPAK
ncbi:MAG: DNA-3-methyladenine glycosylase [Phaeodactylibacter sp.]|nr:DNA-3-methyladenine glycosylase [Phaeodactylibacter sp.]